MYKRQVDLVREEIQFVLDREEIVDCFQDLLRSGKISFRVTHNDKKINNVLMDKDTKKGICAVSYTHLDVYKRQGRFLPYFFPDTFHEGGDPVKEAKENWVTARRAILRKPIDRIGSVSYTHLDVYKRQVVLSIQ